MTRVDPAARLAAMAATRVRAVVERLGGSERLRLVDRIANGSPKAGVACLKAAVGEGPVVADMRP